jgi:hypothetical protein
MYNEENVDFVGMFSSPLSETYIKLFHRGTTKYEPMSEGSKPVQMDIAKGRIRPEPKFWGIGTGYTWKSLVEDTSQEVLETQYQLQLTDREFMRMQALAPLLEEPGSVSHKWGMWDGNFKSEEGIDTPPAYGVHTFTSSHTHYVGTGVPVASGIQLEDLIAAKFHIREHGHFGDLVALVSDKQMSQLEALALPIWDSVSNTGRALGEVGTGGLPTLSNVTKLQNPLTNEVVNSGLRGRLLGVNLVETAYMPHDYFVVAESGRGGMFHQQKSNPSAQGLILFPGESNAWPIMNSIQFRWHKFGVRNRSFAVAYKIGVAAASYTSPTVYVNENY